MQFLVESLPVLEIVGRPLETTMRQGRVFQDVPEFWEQCDRDGSSAWLRDHAGPLGVFGAGLGIDHGGTPFRYLAGVQASARHGEPPQGFVREVLPAGDWAVFRDRGSLPLTLQAMIREVHLSWVPSHPEHRIDRSINLVRYPTFLLGSPRADGTTIHECEVWMPLRRP